MAHYTLPPAVKANEEDLNFWKNRINPALPGMVDEAKYAASLMRKYHLLGDITDAAAADSILRKTDTVFNHKEASVLLSLSGHSILRHRFTDADQYFQKAKAVGLKRYESLVGSFDVDFELGRYANAGIALRNLSSAADFGYYFRKSKMEHLKGSLDSAIASMLKAASLADNADYLKQAALSNAADLCIHAGDLQRANDLYLECIRINPADFHSITGLGWIALVHDANDSLAERIFHFVNTQTRLPDPLFKLAQVAGQRHDGIAQTMYARQFESFATNAVYGNMYHKYLIELYTGILQEPGMALKLAEKELETRATPQTYAWYAYCLAKNGNKEQAYRIFSEHVSGQALEAGELYQMGVLMVVLGKNYNARAFFKAAYENKYDLSPEIVNDLRIRLEE